MHLPVGGPPLQKHGDRHGEGPHSVGGGNEAPFKFDVIAQKAKFFQKRDVSPGS